MRCEGWTRTGGAFSFGPIVWSQCENDAVVNLTVVQDGVEEVQPACVDCWNKGIEKGIVIKSVVPLQTEKATP
jgi:hypothetical protein